MTTQTERKPFYRDGDPGETERIAAAGSLQKFLRVDFLGGAAKFGVVSVEDANTIPHLTQTILSPLLPENGSAKSFDDMFVIGSVARTIADKAVHGTVFDGGWENYAELRKTAAKLAASKNGKLRVLAKGYSDFSTDLDIKVTGLQVPITEFAYQIARAHQIQRTGEGPNTHFSFPLSGYKVEISVFAQPTNPSIEILQIAFKDKRNGKIFHVDIKKGTLHDKRSGETTFIQDHCVARLQNDHGELKYVMKKDAVDALKHQDIFDSESKDVSVLLELFLRALRQSLLPPKDQILLDSGVPFELPRFDIFLPQFVSAVDERRRSLFGLRDNMRELYHTGRIDLPYENLNQIAQLQQLLADCLQFDPHVTVQALRDSGVAYAIPGLRDITHREWNQLLTAPEMIVDFSRWGTAHPRANERTFELMKEQREYYLGRRGGKRHFDGLERFMRALGAVEGNEYEAYLDIWEKPKQVEADIASIATNQFGPKISALRLTMPGQEYLVMKPDGTFEPTDQDKFETSLRRQTQSPFDSKLSWPKRVDFALRLINGFSHDPEISRIYAAQNKTIEEQRLMQSIGNIAAILRFDPSGVTPQEMERIYNRMRDQEITLLPFPEAFFRLKKTGCVALAPIPDQRINRRGELAPMTMYSWRSPDEMTGLKKLLSQDVPNNVRYAASILQNASITTTQVILSLTETDIPFIKYGSEMLKDNLPLLQIAVKEWLAEAFM